MVNGTTDTQIYKVVIAAFPFGQSLFVPSGDFLFSESSPLGPDEEFGIVLSPYVYRIVVTVRYYITGDEMNERSRTATIDLVEKAAEPTYITLTTVQIGESTAQALEVTGVYVNSYSTVLN